MDSRQIVLDTETTGLEHKQGHKIIEIGCVEVINRRLTGNNYHVYLNPDREIDQGAMEVHGISNEDLQDKPRFHEIVDAFMDYIHGAELVIHNAPFDVGFLDAELQKLENETRKIHDVCSVFDTLTQARKMFPGQRNDLDSLCKRYEINNSHRVLHGALLDAEILADVYLIMTGGQTDLSLDSGSDASMSQNTQSSQIDLTSLTLPRVQPSAEELEVHRQWVKDLDEKVDGQCVWSRMNEN